MVSVIGLKDSKAANQCDFKNKKYIHQLKRKTRRWVVKGLGSGRGGRSMDRGMGKDEWMLESGAKR